MKINEASKLKSARAIALVGIMTASLTCGKLALSFLPNIEVVTLLTALYGYVFGVYGIVASALFVCIEPLIYGFGSWILTYFLYWPFVSFAFMMLRSVGVRKRLPLTACALVLTLWFGILSSVVETALYLGINEYFFKNLCLYYIRGAVFYALQLASNLALFPTLFVYLSARLEEIRQRFDI